MAIRLGRRFLDLILIAILTASISIIIVFYGMASSWDSNKGQILSYLKETDANVSSEIAEFLIPLSSTFSGGSCSDEVIKAMQMAQFRSYYFHEFGFISNNYLLCTSSLGVLDEPVKQEAYSLNGEVSFNRLTPVPILNDGTTAMTIKIGNIQAFFRPFTSPYIKNHWTDVSVYTFNNGEWHLISGNDLVAPSRLAVSTVESNGFESPYWVYESCYAETTCAVITINVVEYIKAKSLVFLICTVLILVITTLSSIAFWQFQKNFYSLNRQIKRGVNTRQVKCYYQPIMDMKNGNISGCEVLCRWENTRGKLIFPDIFIKDIVKNDQEKELTEIVVSKAIMELADKNILGSLQVSFNAFPSDVSSGFVAEILKKYLDKQYYSNMTVEVTEDQVEDMALISEKIDQLRHMGIKVSIDDFGTGYSNLQHIKELNIDTLKIDKSFVFAMHDNAIKGALVKHITELAHTLGVSMVAEGVENQEQLCELKRLGVTYSQGFLHSRPVPIHEFYEFYKTHKTHV